MSSCECVAVQYPSKKLMVLLEKAETAINSRYVSEREAMVKRASIKRNWFLGLFLHPEWHNVSYLDKAHKYKTDRIYELIKAASVSDNVSMSLSVLKWIDHHVEEEFGW